MPDISLNLLKGMFLKVPFLLQSRSEIFLRILEISVIIKILGCDSNVLIATSTRLFRLEVSPKVKHFVFRCKDLTTYTKKSNY